MNLSIIISRTSLSVSLSEFTCNALTVGIIAWWSDTFVSSITALVLIVTLISLWLHICSAKFRASISIDAFKNLESVLGYVISFFSYSDCATSSVFFAFNPKRLLHSFCSNVISNNIGAFFLFISLFTDWMMEHVPSTARTIDSASSLFSNLTSYSATISS